MHKATKTRGFNVNDNKIRNHSNNSKYNLKKKKNNNSTVK